jgi:hypothetical protein
MQPPKEPHQPKREGEPTISFSPKTERNPHPSSKPERANNKETPEGETLLSVAPVLPNLGFDSRKRRGDSTHSQDDESHLTSPDPTLRDHQPHLLPERNKKGFPGSISRRSGRGRDETHHRSMRLQKGRHQVPVSENQPRPAGRKILPELPTPALQLSAACDGPALPLADLPPPTPPHSDSRGS